MMAHGGQLFIATKFFNPDSSGVGLFKVFYDRTRSKWLCHYPKVNTQHQALTHLLLKDSSTFCTDGGSILLTEELVTTFVPNGSTTTFYINNIQVPENYNLNFLANTYIYVKAHSPARQMTQ
ncbi:MAG: hypothetical protein IPP37_17440 [Saprospiraceae bacterium]|nr:hypothetical protein [Saprospiraceae bacterium]